jgi:hypothetical protein
MRTPSDPGRFPRARRLRRISLPILALAALLLPAAYPSQPAAAQARPRPIPKAVATPAAPARSELRQKITERYEVLPVRGGLLLKPRSSRVGVHSIELTGGAGGTGGADATDANIAVNGETVTPSVLRAWLGDDAPAVLELAALAPAERRQLFGLAAEAEGAARVPPAGAASTLPPPKPTPPAAAPSGESGDKGEKGTEPATPTVPEPPEPPAPPTSISSGPQVRVGGGVTVRENEVAEDVVAIGGPVHMDGEATGDVTAIGGSVTINGKVGGGVSAVAGSVRLGPKAEVMGDITCVLGHIEADPAAKVHGAKTEVTPGEVITGRHRLGRHGVNIDLWPFRSAFRFIDHLVWMILLGLLSCFFLLVARPTVERLEARIAAEPWKAGLAGFLSQIFFLPLLIVVTVVLIISIVGCALLVLYPFLFLALFVAGLLGYAAVAYRVGRLFEGRFSDRFGNPYFAALLGVVVIESLCLLGRLFDVAGFLSPIAGLFLAAGVIVQYCAWTVGFGAFVLDRMERGFRRRPTEPPAPVPPPPPPPPAPVTPPPREPWEAEP